MDGRGRVAQPLTWAARARAWPQRFAASRPRALFDAPMEPSNLQSTARRIWISILRFDLPRGVGLTAAMIVMLGGLAYGVVKGEHLPALITAFDDARNEAANTAGFRIVSVALSGNKHISRDEVIGIVGVTAKTSLLFLDVADARALLKGHPWVADATVLKLYPGELQISLTERAPFALWQNQGQVFVIADDGTVLELYVPPKPSAPASLVDLPFVVGRGADTRAKDFLALVDRHPVIRDQVRAAVLVGERRWNLRLRNGLDVRLPETDVWQALDRLAALDRDAKLMSRDILHIDLRLADRVTVRLSPAAAQSRSDALKDKKPPAKKGGNA
jgi:cell division protein FtsQ